MAKARTRQRTSFGVLFWIATILLVAVLFMVNLPSMRAVLDRTNFVEVVFEQPPADTAADPTVEPNPGATPPPTAPPESTAAESEPAPNEPDGALGTTDATEPGAEGPAAGAKRADSEDAESEGAIVVVPPANESTADSAPERTRQSNLFFIRVTDDGRILAEAVERSIRFGSSPLTETIGALVTGPTADDLNRGLLSLVPAGTRLRSARVDGGVAYLDFSEEFRFNPMGLEGYLAQMQQVVRTATAFPTVEAVQILIEGQQVSYLGGDGVYIGAPVRAEDFSI